MHSEIYLNNQDHFDSNYPYVAMIDQVFMYQYRHCVFLPPKQTRRVSDYDYMEFYTQALRYWVYKRYMTRCDIVEVFQPLTNMYDNDPLLKDWVFFIWQTAIDIEKNDGKILEEVMDDEMQEAYESGTLEQSIPIQAPIIPNTNERYNFEHIY